MVATTFLAAMFITTLIILVITRLATDRIAHNHYRQKADFFAHNPIVPGDIVFVGDSITDGACWDELFPDLPVKNRGINADTTSGVLHRLPDVLDGKPAAIFILIGTNDLPWFMYKSNEDILDMYADILTRCQEYSPKTKVHVQSILPRNRRLLKRIKLINKGLEKLAAKHGGTYIDLFTHFMGKDGSLRDDFTNDHLHLMADGYKRWVEILLPYLSKIK